MQLLQDIFIIEQLQVLSEGKTDGPMKIRGVFGRCNEKNNNGRIYPTAVLESQLSKVQPLIAERRLCGELDHPANDTVKLSNASHLITKLDMKGNELIGEAEILKTPAGLTAKALVEGGVKIGISSRGMGTLSEDHNGDKIVNEDFRLVTFDLVADPSTRGAFPGLSESTESKFVQESQSKLKKESNFVTMIESKLRDAYKPFIEENTTIGYTTKSSKKKEAEKKAKKKAKKKNLPGNQEAIDADGDGNIEASDFAKLRKESMDLIRKEGSWHKIAYALAEVLGHDVSEAELTSQQKANRAAYDRGEHPKKPKEPKNEPKKKVDEAFADELDKESKRSLAPQNAAKDTGGMLSNFRARRHAKGMEVAASKGRVKGKGIEQRGEIKRARIGQKAQDAAAAGGPVTTGEKVMAGAGKAAGAIAGGAKAIAGAPGKAIGAAERTTDAIKQRRRQNKLQNADRESARGRIEARAKRKDGGPQNAPKPTAGIPELPAGTQRTAPAGKGAHPEARAAQTSPVSQSGSNINPDLQRRFNKVKSKQGSSRQSLGTTRERMMKKGQLTRPGQGGQISASTAYTQLGYIIAEMLNVKTEPKSTKTTRKPKSGEYQRSGKGGGERIKTVPTTQDETKDKSEQGSTRA